MSPWLRRQSCDAADELKLGAMWAAPHSQSDIKNKKLTVRYWQRLSYALLPVLHSKAMLSVN